MAYRRKHGPQRSLTFIEDTRSSFAGDESSPTSPQLAAARASAAHRDNPSLSSSEPSDEPASHRTPKQLLRSATYANPQDATAYDCTPTKDMNEAKYGFWGVLARKAKSILEDDIVSQQFEDHDRSHLQMRDTSAGSQFDQSSYSSDSYPHSENTSLNKGRESASSLHQIGGTIKNALEDGLTIVEDRTADIIQETRKLQIKRKSGSFCARNQPTDLSASKYLYPDLNDYETQLKASRDVANAMAAKAKLLLRELKTVKADLAFANERCAQLEDENRLLRESRDKGDILEDDDLIRVQLETLLEEKGRLAHENSIYSRENRFLREIVEYHQLTMQDVIYVNEGIEEVEEVCPIQLPPHLTDPSPRRLSPIISRPGSANSSNHTSPRSFTNYEDTPEVFLTAASASPSTPSSPRNIKTKARSLPSSPKPGNLRRQNSLPPA